MTQKLAARTYLQVPAWRGDKDGVTSAVRLLFIRHGFRRRTSMNFPKYRSFRHHPSLFTLCLREFPRRQSRARSTEISTVGMARQLLSSRTDKFGSKPTTT